MHLDILIDASGSMGYMKGQGEQHENKYLIDERHTRTDLVKDILKNNLIGGLGFTDTISIESFLNRKKLNSVGNPIIKNKQYVEYADLISQFSGKYNQTELINSIQKIDNPEPGGTPLRWSLLYKVNKSTSPNHHIIIFSDGEGYWESKIDEEWPDIIIKLIKSKAKNICIHFVGIAQTEAVQKKCKHVCSETNGTYTNLKSMNYEVSELDRLLFHLKSNIVSNAISTNIPVLDNTPKHSTEKEVFSLEISNKENQNNNKPIGHNLELQVNRNTKSLELITNQLDNIVKLLSSKNELIDEVLIDENTELNLKIGRLAEEFLYRELSKNDWDINWLNKDGEKFMPYDFEIKFDNKIYYYECKGTLNNLNEFQSTKNEWLFYLKNKGRYRLCFVTNVNSNPSYICFMDLLEDMKDGRLLPLSERNIKLKSDRIIFTVKATSTQ